MSGGVPRQLEFARQPWMVRAACRGIGPDAFFLGRGEDTSPAKAICAECPVRAECQALIESLPAGTPGIWAGLSERDRRLRRYQQRRAS